MNNILEEKTKEELIERVKFVQNEYFELNREKDKEIERLKKKLDCDLQWAKKYDELFEENNRLHNIIDELKDDSRILKEFSAWIVNRHEPDLFHKMEIVNKLSKLKEGKENEKNI